MYVEAPLTSSAGGHLLPALDFRSGFNGDGDRRLRLFAADCAKHLVPRDRSAGRAYGRDRRPIMLYVGRAKRRANGRLRGAELLTAFAEAGFDLAEFSRRTPPGDGDSPIDDALSSAYCALCAPTPRDAAKHAANCASMTVDGALRESEHRRQLRLLDAYRSIAARH